MADASYDYIVIGSGAGGGPVASNLARNGYSVLLLEAGGDCDDWNYQVPVFHPLASEDEKMSWAFFVRHYANQAQQELDSKFYKPENGIFYPRSGTLGGCTAHNAMIAVYPHNSDWDHIAQLTGDESWAGENMRKYFERMERCQYISGWKRFLQAIVGLLTKGTTNPSRHGYGGWLTTNAADIKLLLGDPELLKIVLAAVGKAFVSGVDDPGLTLETKLDPNDWRFNTSPRREGLSIAPLATNGGRRTGTREFILQTAQQHPGKLTIETNALATRILFDDDKRAIGVEYLKGSYLYKASRVERGKTQEKRVAEVNREVILSGGAFNSPQLLMLSGIGPSETLSKHGIGLVHDLPGVGRNLQDRYEVGVISEMGKDFALLKGATFQGPEPGQPGDPLFQQWQQGKGVYTTNGAVIAIIKRSAPQKPDPDLFIFGLPSYFKGYEPGYSKALKRYSNMFTWAILKAHTENTSGVVTLRSADPCDVPDINFCYFNEGNDRDGQDLQAVINGVKFARSINNLLPPSVQHKEVLPGPNVATDAQIGEFIRNEAWGHHASCTNKMGRGDDPSAVVDSRFRVHGVQGLRVVDASIFPRIPGFFIVSAVYMIAEKASEVIAEDAKSTPARLRKPMGAPVTA
jgi:choline dehydrogenase